MGTKDKRVDQYIANAAPFAQPILNQIRALVHAACPDVSETMKWSFPHFDYVGQILCSMASFKQHCAFGFWKGSILSDPKGILEHDGKTAMGSLGRLTTLSDLPKDNVLIAYIKEAAKLNREGVNRPAPKKAATKKELDVPDYFLKALSKNAAARKTFESFSPSNKKEYVEWVAGGKTDETRSKRLATSIEWMSEGKIRHWKYVK